MNLLHLEYFYTVAKEGGFLRASEKMRIQQPAISRMVGQLEEYFSFKLFEKVGRNVALTQKGQEVFEHCEKIFGQVNLLKTSIGKISGVCKGPLIIAAAEPVASHFLPNILSIILKNHPQIYPQIFSGPSSLLLKKIENSEIELGLFFHLPDLSKKLIVINKYPIKFRLVIRHDLKKNREALTSFIGSREIDDSNAQNFPTLEKLKKKYSEAKIKISSNNLSAHKEMVMAGLGVSVLPEFLVHDDLKSKKLADVLDGEEFVFYLKLVKRVNAELSLNGMSLLNILGNKK
jgi:DNA-binding transcriptional LysR family regulator